MQTKVVKFGGSSLADAEHFRQVADIIRADSSRRFVVPSAPGKRFEGDTKVTDMLYRCYEMLKNREDADAYYGQIRERYNRIIRELGMNYDISGELQYVMGAMCHASGRDYAASRGEYLCGLILAKYLGYDFVDAENVIFFRENGTFDEERTNEALSRELARHAHAVIPGFYGAMPNGTVKTFSRGGSDITGSIVARAVDADLYENWTDVSGFLMADPRVVKDPPTIETITYRELRELSYMGASVLHDESIFPVRYAGIPINIRNTNRPQDPGTFIVPTLPANAHKRKVTGIAGHKGFSSVYVEKSMMNGEIGFVAHLLQIFADYGISFEHCPSGIDTVSIIVSTEALAPAREEILRRIQDELQPDHVSVEDGLALIAVVGQGMIYAKGTAARIFRVIADANINIRMIDQGSCELNIIIAVKETDYELAIRSLYHAVERVM